MGLRIEDVSLQGNGLIWRVEEEKILESLCHPERLHLVCLHLRRVDVVQSRVAALRDATVLIDGREYAPTIFAVLLLVRDTPQQKQTLDNFGPQEIVGRLVGRHRRSELHIFGANPSGRLKIHLGARFDDLLRHVQVVLALLSGQGDIVQYAESQHARHKACQMFHLVNRRCSFERAYVHVSIHGAT